jgi:hypothetical protein
MSRILLICGLVMALSESAGAQSTVSTPITITGVTWRESTQSVCLPAHRMNCYSRVTIYQCSDVVRGPNGLFVLLMNSYANDCVVQQNGSYHLVHDGPRYHLYAINRNPDGTSNDVPTATAAIWWAESPYDHAQCVSMQIKYCP